LKPEVWPAWLGEEPATVRNLKAMLAPYPSEGMICWPISTRVGKRQEQRSEFDRADGSVIR
jgi:putative SOS response-associated peptidase YedK